MQLEATGIKDLLASEDGSACTDTSALPARQVSLDHVFVRAWTSGGVEGIIISYLRSKRLVASINCHCFFMYHWNRFVARRTQSLSCDCVR